MGQKEKVFSENAALLKTLQKKSLENDKISKWVKRLQQEDFPEINNKVNSVQKKDANESSQEILQQVAQDIFQDLIKR